MALAAALTAGSRRIASRVWSILLCNWKPPAGYETEATMTFPAKPVSRVRRFTQDRTNSAAATSRTTVNAACAAATEKPMVRLAGSAADIGRSSTRRSGMRIAARAVAPAAVATSSVAQPANTAARSVTDGSPSAAYSAGMTARTKVKATRVSSNPQAAPAAPRMATSIPISRSTSHWEAPMNARILSSVARWAMRRSSRFARLVAQMTRIRPAVTTVANANIRCR